MTGELRDALERAGEMPDGDGKVAELERLVGHADAIGDVRLGFDVRFELIQAYANHTERWRLLPAFGWCLAAFDRDPSQYTAWDAEMLRWYHKWAVATLRTTHRVGLAQTTAALDDMERRFREGGHSLHVIYNLRCRIHDHVGDNARALHFFELWRTARRDENSDCAGCDPSRQAEHLAGWGRWDEAIEAVEPVLTGAVGCAEQPEKALAAVLLPYVRLGRYADAAGAHVRAYRRHRHERDAFPFMAQHLLFCALTGLFDRGLDLLDRHLPWLDRPYDDYSAMEFAATGALVAGLAAQAGNTRTVHRPEFEGRPAADLTLGTLAADLSTVARERAAQFDRRNGSDHQSRLIDRLLAERPVTDGVELPPDDPGRDAEIAAVLPPEGRQDLLAPLSIEMIVSILNERNDRYVVEEDGSVAGQWGDAVISFDRVGEQNELLHIRAIPERRFAQARLTDLFEFCNGWNHDRLVPKAYVHELDSGDLLVAGECTTDLEHGVSTRQLSVIIQTAISASAALADALSEVP